MFKQWDHIFDIFESTMEDSPVYVTEPKMKEPVETSAVSDIQPLINKEIDITADGYTPTTVEELAIACEKLFKDIDPTDIVSIWRKIIKMMGALKMKNDNNFEQLSERALRQVIRNILNETTLK